MHFHGKGVRTVFTEHILRRLILHDATANDIKQLSEYVQQKVAEKFGIQLKREIILLGEF